MDSVNPNNPVTSDAVVVSHKSKDELQAAFVARKAEIDAIDETDGRANGIDIVESVATIHGALPELLRYRDAAAKLDPAHAEDFDLLEQSAMACEFVEVELRTLSQPPEPITDLIEQGRKRLESLLAGAVGLANGGFFPADYLSEVKGGRAYQDLAMDLMYLSRLYAQRWPGIASKTHIVEADWNEARELGHALLKVLRRRDQQESERDAMLVTRQKAKIALIARWDRCRQPIEYLRYHQGDAAEIAPSLYAARMKRKPAKADIETDDTVLSPVPPVVTPIVGGSPSPAPVPVKSATTLPLSEDPFSA